ETRAACRAAGILAGATWRDARVAIQLCAVPSGVGAVILTRAPEAAGEGGWHEQVVAEAGAELGLAVAHVPMRVAGPAHSRHVRTGRILPGLASPVGSKARRISHIALISESVKIISM